MHQEPEAHQHLGLMLTSLFWLRARLTMASAREGETLTRVSPLLATEARCERLAVGVNDGLLNCLCFMSPRDVCANEGVAWL